MRWFKGSNWLSLSNAKAQVEFWKEDLIQAEKYLEYVKSFEGRGLPRYEKHLKYATNDVNKSRKELSKAIEKLEETKKREGLK